MTSDMVSMSGPHRSAYGVGMTMSDSSAKLAVNCCRLASSCRRSTAARIIVSNSATTTVGEYAARVSSWLST